MPSSSPGAAAPRAHAGGFHAAEAAEATFVLQQLQHAGDWDPPHHSARLLRALRERAGVDTAAERRVVKPLDDALGKEPLLYVTGHGKLDLTQDLGGLDLAVTLVPVDNPNAIRITNKTTTVVTCTGRFTGADAGNTSTIAIKPGKNTVAVGVTGDAPRGPQPDKFGGKRG